MAIKAQRGWINNSPEVQHSAVLETKTHTHRKWTEGCFIVRCSKYFKSPFHIFICEKVTFISVLSLELPSFLSPSTFTPLLFAHPERQLYAAREFLSEAALSPFSVPQREIPRRSLRTSVMAGVRGSSVAAFPHLSFLWLDFISQPAADKLYLHQPGPSTSICLADGLCCGVRLVKHS